MMGNRSWLAGLASKIFLRYRSRAKTTTSWHQPSTILSSETLEPRQLLTANLGLGGQDLVASASLNSSSTTTNNLPELLPSQFIVEHNAATNTLVGTIRGTDADGETLSYAIVSQPNGDSDANDPFVIANTNQLLLNDVDDLGDGSQLSTIDVDVRISDPHGYTDVTIQVVVIPTDNGPDFADTNFSITENAAEGTTVGVLSSSNAGAPVGARGPAIILDDGDSGFSQSGFDYFANPGLAGYETDWHRKKANAGSGEAQWHFTGLADGEYYVSTTWTDKSNRATDAPYTIEDGAGTHLASASVNQRHAPASFEEDGNHWENLGIVHVDSGELVVKLNESPGATGQVIADAINIEIVSYSIVNNFNLDNDGNDAFRLNGDQIVVNDSDDLDFESANTIQLIVRVVLDAAHSSYSKVTINLEDQDIERNLSDWSSTSGWGTLNIADIIETATGTRPSQAELFGDGFGQKHWNVNSVGAPDAWQAGYTGEDIVVAVIDNGVDYTHPDIQNNIWINQHEVPSSIAASVDTSGDSKVSASEVIAYMQSTGGGDLNSDGAVNLIDAIDHASPFMDGSDSSQDVNTMVDDLFGWSFKQLNHNTYQYGTNNPAHQVKSSGGVGKEQWHGTHIAGTIAGTGTSANGVRGIAPSAQIMPVVVLDAANFGCSDTDVYNGVKYAVDNGADVINLSIYWSDNSYRSRSMPKLDAAIEYAIANDCFIAICAGNDSNGSPDRPGSAINTTGGVAVGATQKRGSGGDFDGNSHVNVADLIAPSSIFIDGVDHDGLTFDGNVDNLINQAVLTPASVTAMDFNNDSHVSAAEIKQYFSDNQHDLNADQNYDLADAILDTSLFVGGSAELLFNQSEIPYWIFHTEFDRNADGQLTTSELTDLVTEWADYTNPRFNNKSGSTRMPYLTAPGVNIYSSVPGDHYAREKGTSMATPHVVGAAALLLSARNDWSQQWNQTQLEKIITLTADSHRYDGDGTDGGGSGNSYDGPAVSSNGNIDNHSPPDFSDQTSNVHNEHSGSGGSVHELSASDADGNSLSYLLVDSTVPDVDGDGIPAIVVDGNHLIINDPDDMDHEHHGDSFDVSVVVLDGTHSAMATITIQLNDVNEIPQVNTLAEHVGILDTGLVLENSGDRYLYIADSDDEEMLTELHLVIENDQGTMQLDNADANNLATFTGNGTSYVTLVGTVSDINQALHGMSLEHGPGITAFDLEFRISQDTGQSEVVTVVPVSFVGNVIGNTIIDNSDPGFSQTGFTYQNNVEVSSAYNGDNYNVRYGSNGDLASWNFGGLEDGTYHVMATWAHKYNNKYNATAAPFQMLDAGGNVLSSVSANQRIAPDQHEVSGSFWNTLDTVYVAGGQLTVTLGASATTNMYSVADAICIEQIEQPTPTLVVQLAEPSVSENIGTVSGIVSRGAETTGDLVVALDSDSTYAGTVPATVTIVDGSGSAAFTLTVVDNAIIDGDKSIGILATAGGFVAGSVSLEVVDDDVTILFADNGDEGFTADARFKSGSRGGAYGSDVHWQRGGSGEVSWTFTGLAEGEYFVAATWAYKYNNKYNSEKVPFSITNGSGNLLATTTVDQTQTPGDFTDGGYGWNDLAPVHINDGTLVVTMGAAPTNNYAVADAIRIELNESAAPSLLVLLDTLSESAGASTGTVVRTGETSSAVTVNLTSNNPATATVEATANFLAGESTATFTVTPVDDSAPDGVQQTTIEATAVGYTAGTAVMKVEDDDALEVIVIDNSDSGYGSKGFRHNSNKYLSETYGGNNDILKGGQEGDEASWSFTSLVDGVYHVSATWNHQYNNKYNATDAHYSITNAADEAIGSAVIDQTSVPNELLDGGIGWNTLDTVTVTGGKLVVTLTGGSNPSQRTIADAIRIARVDSVGGSSMQSAAADPFYDPLEDTLDALATEWAGALDDEDQLIWGE